MRQHRSFWIVRVIPMLIAFGLSVLILEAGSYAYLRMTRGYDGLHLMNYQFDPYKIIQLTPNFVDERGVFHNAQGFRRKTDTPKEKPGEVMRVFLMGGSTAYGLESLSRFGRKKYPVIRNDETIDFYLEKAVEGMVPGKRIEVINAAITSFYSHHHLIYLNQQILKFEPDVVIFLDGFNDYYKEEKGFDQFQDFAYSERVHKFMGEPTFDAWARYTGWWLFRKSHFFHAAGRAARNVSFMTSSSSTDRQVINVDTALTEMRYNAEHNWVNMVERNGLILEHEGIDAIFALQPEIALDSSKTKSPLEIQIFDEIEGLWPKNYIDFKKRARPVVLEYLRAAAAISGSHAVDLTEIYEGVEADVYTDYCHLTPTGNQVLAEALKPLVVDSLLARAHDLSVERN